MHHKLFSYPFNVQISFFWDTLPYKVYMITKAWLKYCIHVESCINTSSVATARGPGSELCKFIKLKSFEFDSMAKLWWLFIGKN